MHPICGWIQFRFTLYWIKLLDVKDRVADNTSKDATVLTYGDLSRQFAAVKHTSFCGSKGHPETLYRRDRQNGIGFIQTMNYKTGGKLML